MDALVELFPPNDILLIMKQKPVINREDFWSWKHTKSGNYCVKSGYWLASTIKKPDLFLEASMLPSLNGLKEQIWSLPTVPKIKLFLWRLSSDALPVTDLLARRGISLDTRCQICGNEGESINHVLFTCSVARRLWALSQVPLPQSGFDQVSIHSNLHFLFSLGKNFAVPLEIRRSYPWILWRLWKNINSLVFEARSFDPLDTINKIREDVEAWTLSQQVITENEVIDEEENRKNEMHWCKPPAGWLKCNIGFSRFKKGMINGGAWVLRNDLGVVVLHSRKAFSLAQSKEEACLNVCIWAIESMKSHRLEKVVFACDSKELMGSMLRPKAWPSFALHQSELLLSLSNIQEWRVLYEKTLANKGASFIAQSVPDHELFHSYVSIGYPFWMGELFELERSS